jgi:hypothetical protein
MGVNIMNKSFDVIVAKEYETIQDGKPVKKTAWNRVGRAWPSKSGGSLSFELYLLPQLRYVIQLTDKNADKSRDQNADNEVPF